MWMFKFGWNLNVIYKIYYFQCFFYFIICFYIQKVTDFSEICDEIERETERVTGNNKVCSLFVSNSSILFVLSPLDNDSFRAFLPIITSAPGFTSKIMFLYLMQ